MSDESGGDFLEGSLTVRWARRAAQRVAGWAWTAARRIGGRLRLREWADDLRSEPLRVCGIVLAVAMATHLFLFWALDRPREGWAIPIRLLLLLIGLVCSANRSPWREVREHSVLARLLSRIGRRGGGSDAG